MKMYFDKFSEIGSTHKENEDFAVVGDEEHPFVIVSDGCSGSEETSTGSRILSLSMASILKAYGYHYLIDKHGLGFNAVMMADDIRKRLGTPRECLDATLMMAYVTNDSVSLTVWGDGEIIIGRKDRADYISIGYTEEIPYYLSYSLYLDRKKQFDELAIQRGLLVEINESDKKTHFSPTYVFHRNIDRSNLDYILLSTDGMRSFIDKDNTPVKHSVINDGITSFKRLNGEFIGRRMNRMMKDNAKKEITHYDDFTVAGISFVEE